MVNSTPRPHFTPGKDPVPILQEAGWVPGPVWTGGKSRPHRNSIPDRPARSQSLYRLSSPAHNLSYIGLCMYVHIHFQYVSMYRPYFVKSEQPTVYQFCRGIKKLGFLAIFFFRWAGGWPAASTPNLEDQAIFDQGFLPVALDTPVSNCKAAVLVLVRPGYFISLVPAISGQHSPIRHRGRRPIED